MGDERGRMSRTLIESPFRGKGYDATKMNILYARLCVRDTLLRGESPYASHLFFPQAGILDDTDEAERMWGINAGLAWGACAEVSAIYVDMGLSKGMEYGMINAEKAGRRIEERSLGSAEEVRRKLEEMANAKPAVPTGLLF